MYIANTTIVIASRQNAVILMLIGEKLSWIICRKLGEVGTKIFMYYYTNKRPLTWRHAVRTAVRAGGYWDEDAHFSICIKIK